MDEYGAFSGLRIDLYFYCSRMCYGVRIDPEDGARIFLQNVGAHVFEFTVV
jgi:hypothetical protein